MTHGKLVMDRRPVGEMAIVDTFTKLIFGEASQYSNRELMIISALRKVDEQTSGASHLYLGEYLRALGVTEMIELVARVQAQLILELQAASTRGMGDAGQHGSSGHSLH